MERFDKPHIALRTLRRRAGITQTRLASLIGVEAAVVCRFESGERRITAERAIAIDRATDGCIPRAVLRPDIFGADA